MAQKVSLEKGETCFSRIQDVISLDIFFFLQSQKFNTRLFIPMESIRSFCEMKDFKIETNIRLFHVTSTEKAKHFLLKSNRGSKTFDGLENNFWLFDV